MTRIRIEFEPEESEVAWRPWSMTAVEVSDDAMYIENEVGEFIALPVNAIDKLEYAFKTIREKMAEAK